MEKSNLNELNESLKRHRELLGYDPSKGTSSLDEVRRHKYTLGEDAYTDYAEDETKDEETDNADFDFGDTEEQNTETTETGDEGGFGFGDETEQTDTEETDEFGTASEFSAADDIELDQSSEEVEEVDVTDIVKRADDAKEYAEKAVSAAEEGKGMIKDLMSKFDSLQQSLAKLDNVAVELNTIKKDIQSQKPKEKLELRSLDSYPFNVKLTDYWNDDKLKDNYEVVAGTESTDGNVKAYKVEPSDVTNYNQVDIKKSFVPESTLKKKVLTEQELLTENQLWDDIRDIWFDLTHVIKSTGYSSSKVPSLYELKKKGDQEGYDKVVEDIYNYTEKLYRKHPNNEFKIKIKKLLKRLDNVGTDEKTVTQEE